MYFPPSYKIPQSPPILSSIQTPRVPQTLTENIVQRYSVGLGNNQYVKAGDYVSLSPAYVMTQDNSWPTALKFMGFGGTKITIQSKS